MLTTIGWQTSPREGHSSSIFRRRGHGEALIMHIRAQPCSEANTETSFRGGWTLLSSALRGPGAEGKMCAPKPRLTYPPVS